MAAMGQVLAIWIHVTALEDFVRMLLKLNVLESMLQRSLGNRTSRLA